MSWLNDFWNKTINVISAPFQWVAVRSGANDNATQPDDMAALLKETGYQNLEEAQKQQYAHYEQAINEAIAFTKNIYDKCSNADVLMKIYERQANADLNHDGLITGEEESRLLIKSYLSGNTPDSIAARQSILELEDTREQMPADMFDAIAEQTSDAMLLSVKDQGFISLSKAVARAIKSGKSLDAAQEALTSHYAEQCLHLLLNMPVLGMLDSDPFLNEAQKEQLGEKLGQGFVEAGAHYMRQYVDLMKEHPELTEATLNQPDLGRFAEFSWADFVETSKSAEKAASQGAAVS